MLTPGVVREEGGFLLAEERAIIDLGLNMPGVVGASDSDRTSITVSPFGSSHGYASVNVVPARGKYRGRVQGSGGGRDGQLNRVTIDLPPYALVCYRAEQAGHGAHITSSSYPISPKAGTENRRFAPFPY